MSPPTKAPPKPTLDRQVEAPAPAIGGTGADAAPAMAPPHAAAISGQQSAGNRAMSAVLGAGRGIQRAPNDGTPGGDAGVADAQARADERVNRSNVQPIQDPDEAARLYLDQRAGAGGNVAIARRDMFENRWRYGHHQQRDAPVAGWRNADGTVVIDKSNPQVKDAVERLALARGAPGGGGGAGGGGGGTSGPGGGGTPDRGDPRISGMAHGPTLNSSGGVATAPTLPGGQTPRPSRPMGSTAVAVGRDEEDGAPAPAPRPNRPMGSTAVAVGRDEEDGAPAPARPQQQQGGPKAPTPGGGPGGGSPPGGGPGPGGGKFEPPRLKVATGVDVAHAQAEFKVNPARVYRSENAGTHQAWWDLEPMSQGKAPPVIRSGNTYIVGPEVDGPDLPPKKANPAEHDDYAADREVADLGKHLDKRMADAKAGGGQAPVNPPTPGQRRIDPSARPRDPEPGMKQAVPVTHDEVVDALKKNPDKVYQSKRYDTHAEWYTADKGKGAWPRAYRSGSTIIVDPDYPLDGQRPGPKPTPSTPSGPDPTTKATQTISPTGYVPQEKKPAKLDVRKGEISRETAQEAARVTEQGTDKRIDSRKTGYSVAKGATYERKQRDESQTGDTFKATEKARKLSGDLGGIKFNQESVKEYGSTPDGPKTKVEKNVGGGLGPDGLTGNASTAITSQSGLKAEAKGDVKLGPDGIALSGTGTITTPKGFTGHLSVSGKHNVVASDPKETEKGKFAVDFVMTDESGAEIGGGWQQQGGMGASVSVQAGSTTTNKAYQTRVFDTKAEALIFQLTAAAQIGDPGESMKKATTADGAKAMKEGEVRGTSKADTDSVGGGLGMSQVSVGVAWSDTSTSGLKIQKMAGDKIRVTPSIAEQKAFNASISVGGKFGNTKGESETNSFAVTYEFDLGTPGGQKAFEKYCVQRLPPPMPPDAKWIDSTTGHQMEEHDIYKFAHIGEIGWGDHSTQETVQDEYGIHTTAIGGQSERVELNALRKLTFDKNRHAEANIIGRMDNGQITQLAAHMTVGGEDGEFNREQFKRLFSDKGAPAGTPVKNSGEWTLTADIDKKMFEELGQLDDKMKKAKTREEKLKAYSELAQKNGPGMLSGQVRGSAKKLAWNLELKGDPNFPGASGRAALNAQRAKLNAQLEAKPDAAGSIAAEAKDAITSLTQRRKAVADKTKYTDLPDELRQEQVEVIDMHLAEFKSVRSRALSVQMRGGRQGDLVSYLQRVQDEHGYDDVKVGDRAWRKAQDLVAIHETVLNESEKEIAGLRSVVFKMIGATGDVRWGKGVHKQVYQNHNANVKQHIKTFRDQAPRLTEAVTKMRAQKEKWSEEPDPKQRENLLREYDAYVIAALNVTDVQMQALRDAAGAAYAVAPDAAVNYEPAQKVFKSIHVDETTRMHAGAGLDDDGSVIAN